VKPDRTLPSSLRRDHLGRYIPMFTYIYGKVSIVPWRPRRTWWGKSSDITSFTHRFHEVNEPHATSVLITNANRDVFAASHRPAKQNNMLVYESRLPTQLDITPTPTLTIFQERPRFPRGSKRDKTDHD
jgi:hypothetical protein